MTTNLTNDALQTESGLALVIGSGGGLGAALVAQLGQGEGSTSVYSRVLSLGRETQPPLDYANEASIAAAASWVAAQCAELKLDLRLIVVASGFLHGPQGQPERSLGQLDANYLSHVFLINSIGPALVMKHFLPLLPKRGRCAAAFISARVGSISDNSLGGWYGYRASKAALNQLVKTASVELTRRNAQTVCVALHPGTVDTALSRPFAKTALVVRPASESAKAMLDVLKALAPSDTGRLFDYQGKMIPW